MWTEDRKKAERAIIEIVALYHQARHKKNHAAANAYDRAIRVIRRQFKEAPASDCEPDGNTKHSKPSTQPSGPQSGASSVR